MFLKTVYRHSKGLFIFFSLFISLQLFFTVMGIDNWPFINWGMYSATASAPDDYEVLILEINGQGLDYHDEPQFTSDMLLTPIKKYDDWHRYSSQRPFFIKRMKNISAIIPDDIIKAYEAQVEDVLEKPDQERFADWLRRYLQEVTGEEVKELRVVKGKFYYNEQNQLLSAGSEVILQHEWN